MINEHHGEIFFAKWNPNKNYLATGGAGDCYVDVWDYNLLNSKSSSGPAPWMQLRHISVINEAEVPKRADDDHYISSIQWSNNGERLLTSAYDNISRVWNQQGKLEGLFKAQSSLIHSCWNKNDTLVASGGDETNVLIWNPNTIQKEPLYEFQQGGQIIDIAWQNDRQLAAASGQDIYLWTIENTSNKLPLKIWQGHNNVIESIKWDAKGSLLASSAQDDSQVLIWSPKSRQYLMSLNDHDASIRDFKWSNVDPNSINPNSAGTGIIVTLSMDQSIKIYDISRKQASCLHTLKHTTHIGSLSLSPDNSLLAVGGQNSDIYIWSLKDYRQIRSFYNPQPQVEGAGDVDPNSKAIFDINWSYDGTVVAAGFEKSVVMLDMRRILSQSSDGLQHNMNAVSKNTGPGTASGGAHSNAN